MKKGANNNNLDIILFAYSREIHISTKDMPVLRILQIRLLIHEKLQVTRLVSIPVKIDSINYIITQHVVIVLSLLMWFTGSYSTIGCWGRHYSAE